MICYRNGGCGPYENRSCSECPASKPEYVNRCSKPRICEVLGVEINERFSIGHTGKEYFIDKSGSLIYRTEPCNVSELIFLINNPKKLKRIGWNDNA